MLRQENPGVVWKALMQRLSKALLCFFVLGLASITPGSEADDDDDRDCKTIEATLISTADFAAFTTQGEITGDLEGATMLTGDAASIAQIMSLAAPPVEPLTLSYTGALEIVTEDGTLTTRSVGVFEFAPFGVGTQYDRVIGGTGEFEGATGVLYLNYVAGDFVAGGNETVFTNQVTGEICTIDDDDDDDDDDD